MNVFFLLQKFSVDVLKVDRRGLCDGGASKSRATTRYPCASLRVGPLLFAGADLGMLVSPLNQGAPMRDVVLGGLEN